MLTRELKEGGQVAALVAHHKLVILDPLVELARTLATVVCLEVVQLLEDDTDKFVHLEQQIGVISQHLAGQVVVFVAAEHARLGHHGDDGLDEVLEALVHKLRLDISQLVLQRQVRKVILEILLHLGLDEAIALLEPLAHCVKVMHEAVHVGRSVQKLVAAMPEARHKDGALHLVFKTCDSISLLFLSELIKVVNVLFHPDSVVFTTQIFNV